MSRTAVIDEPIRVAAGAVPCERCGISVPHVPGLATSEITVVGREGEPALEPPGAYPRAQLRITMARCPACQAIRSEAEALIRRFPLVAARRGPDVATHLLESALDALVILGVEATPTTEAAVESLIRNLAEPGHLATWGSRYAPIMVRNARAGQAAPHGWACVPPSRRARVRDGWAAILAERVASASGPVRLTPPTPRPAPGERPIAGACAFCGVGSVTLTAQEVTFLGGRAAAREAAWHPLLVDSTALGGPRSPGLISGYTCPACTRAINSVGSVGPTAVERALIAYLKTVDRADDAERLASMLPLESVPTWGGLALAAWRRRDHCRPVNSTPWAHLDLSPAPVPAVEATS